MKVATLETLYCDAGWRPWIFLKATTDDGLVGWSEVTDSHGSPRGLAGIVEDLAPLVVGRDPRAWEAVYWDLYRATRQSPGGVVAKAIAAVENALLDLTAKSHDVAVYELFGGPLRTEVPVYWSHCGTTRARAWEVTGTPKLASYEDVTALGREVVERGLSGLQDERRRARRRPAGAAPGVPRPGARAELVARGGGGARPAAGGVRRRHGRQGRADRRPQLQPHDGGSQAYGGDARRRTTSRGSRSTASTRMPSRSSDARRRSRSAPARISTARAASGRSSKPARSMWRQST